MRVVSWVLMSPILNRFQHLFVVGLHLVLYSSLDGVNLAPHSLNKDVVVANTTTIHPQRSPAPVRRLCMTDALLQRGLIHSPSGSVDNGGVRHAMCQPR